MNPIASLALALLRHINHRRLKRVFNPNLSVFSVWVHTLLEHTINICTETRGLHKTACPHDWESERMGEKVAKNRPGIALCRCHA